MADSTRRMLSPSEPGHLRVGDDVLGIVRLAWHCGLDVVRWRVDGREWLRHIDRLCVRALPLLWVGSVVVGGVVAMQGLGYIARYQATEVFGWAAGVSAFREVGPLLLGLILAARIGARNTAEIGTMVLQERLSALQALGLDPMRVVLVPRMLAIFAASILAFPIVSLTVLVSGFAIANIVGDQRISVSVYSCLEYMSHHVVWDGFVRLAAFGFWIAITSTHYGLRADPRRGGIGHAVYAASVAAMIGIVLLNLYLTLSTGSTS